MRGFRLLPAVLRLNSWHCAQRTLLAVFGKSYMVLGIKLGLAMCKAYIVLLIRLSVVLETTRNQKALGNVLLRVGMRS